MTLKLYTERSPIQEVMNAFEWLIWVILRLSGRPILTLDMVVIFKKCPSAGDIDFPDYVNWIDGL